MGAIFLAGYVALIGVATFLLKYAMKDLSPYQLSFLMALGMVVTGVPALWARSVRSPSRATRWLLVHSSG